MQISQRTKDAADEYRQARDAFVDPPTLSDEDCQQLRRACDRAARRLADRLLVDIELAAQR